MKNLSKITTAVLFGVWLIVMWRASVSFQPQSFEVPTETLGNSKIVGEEKAAVAMFYAPTIQRLKSPFAISRYNQLLARNIFVKPEKPLVVFTPQDLTFVSAELVNLPFMYNGFIQTPSGYIIGQVNWAGKTYFVKKGDKFKDYKVLEIERKSMKVQGKEGQLVLDYKKPVKGKEYIAKLRNELDGQIYEVRVGDEINGYKVLDIRQDSVILYGQNKEWVIKKGR